MCDAIRELFADELKEGYESGRKAGCEEGREEGREQGLKQGIALAKTVIRMKMEGKTMGEIARLCQITTDEVKEILED